MVDKATPVGFMCDFEVLEILRSVRKAPARSEVPTLVSAADQEGKQRLATVVYEAVKFLENTPCGKQTAEQVEKFMLGVKPFGLKKLEKLQFLNLVPQAPVDLHLLVKDCEQRFSDEEIQKLIELVQESFPECKKEEEEEEEEEEEQKAENTEEPEVEDDEDFQEPLPDSDEC
ncbi:unnamed protein product [Notodromas monacha]|uniref:DNA-directed RNA polymerase III subunit RPC9 n=1 Tax=Notodromas monacha TaxID=399045 RepID=A0A7R9GDD2_9CRUS|nr:unnamed protein product [Notodromas monacha]CAG0918563.1 unnamed protein product [Notodromas monacha]